MEGDGSGERAHQGAPPLDPAIQQVREHGAHHADADEKEFFPLGPPPPRVVPVAVPGGPHCLNVPKLSCSQFRNNVSCQAARDV